MASVFSFISFDLVVIELGKNYQQVDQTRFEDTPGQDHPYVILSSVERSACAEGVCLSHEKMPGWPETELAQNTSNYLNLA